MYHRFTDDRILTPGQFDSHQLDLYTHPVLRLSPDREAGSAHSIDSFPLTVFVFSIGFIFFNQAYHGDEYQKRASGIFNEGIIPAIEYAAEEKGNSLICFTEQRYSLYIYVLLTQRYHPSDYIDQLEWIDPLGPADPARTPRALKNYRFRLSDCAGDPNAVYILTLKEEPPVSGVKYKDKKLENFLVFLPK